MQVSLQFVNQIVGKIVDYVASKPREQLGYLMHYRRHIDNLKEQADNLQISRDRLQRQIDAAKRNVEEIEPDVQKWVDPVDDLAKEAKGFLEADQAKANHRCFNGWCINLRSRYKSGKEAYEKATEITKHQDPKFVSVSYPAPLPEIEPSSSREIFSAFESRKSTVKKIMEALEDKRVNVIGICGMGGVGKTTIVEEVRRQAKEKKLFDEMAMVTVSQTPSLMKIQDRIAAKLGVSFGSSEDESERARKLWARIKQEKKILVILDDVWTWLDLVKVGIPYGEDHMDCKIVLASRSQDVCNEMSAQKIFPIKVLSEQEAWVLFREKVGEAVDSSDLNRTAREVARECGGLPVAIVTVGRALRNRNKYEWIDAARQLKKSVPAKIKGMDAFVYSSLELSYNYLDSEEAKSCFLLCSLFPEDDHIPVEALVKYGMGLRLFEGVDTIEEGRVRAHALVSVLLSSFLLLKDAWGVRMHDVVRDVAISIASKEENNNIKYMVKAGIGLSGWPNNDTTFQNYTGISLMRNDIREFPDGLECPKLQTLLLQRNSQDSKLNVPINFFRGMEGLKVLDMSRNHLWYLPPSIAWLTTLRALCLDYCCLVDIAIVGTLKQLEILSLSHSDIKEVPGHFSQLTHLRLFDLRDCSHLKQISPGVISSLCKLEELYIGSSFSAWAVEEEGEENAISNNASLVELKSLSRLTTLHVCVPNADMLPHVLEFHNLIRFSISIGNTDVRELANKNLSLIYDKKLSRPVEVLVKRTEGLSLIDSKGLIKNILKDLLDNDDHGFDDLKYLELETCSEMKYLLDTVDWEAPSTPRVAAFCNLEELKLRDLVNFSEICHGQLPADESFTKLRELSVYYCHSVSNIVTSSLLSRMQYLIRLDARACFSLVTVFDPEGLATDLQGEDTLGLLLSSLETLYLDGLPELMNIWKAPHRHFVNLCNLRDVSLFNCVKLRQLFPPSLVQGLVSLEKLEVIGCSNLEEIFGKKQDQEEQQIEVVVLAKISTLSTSTTSLQNLTRIGVHGCNRLRNIFSVSIAKGLAQLKNLSIISCAIIEAVVVEDDQKVSSIDQKIIVFPRLDVIQLYKLDSLTCFCTGPYAVECPSLERVIIRYCPKMETFGHGVQITPNLKKVEVGDDEEIWMGDLNATFQHLFKQKAKPPERAGAQSPLC